MAVGESARRHRADRGRVWVVVLSMAVPLIASTRAFGATPAGTVVVSVVSASWEGGVATPESVSFTVAQYSDVAVDPVTAAAAGAAGDSVPYAVRITNRGNGTDRFVLQLMGEQGWPAAVYRDDDGDGLLRPGETTPAPATPLLAPGEHFAAVVVVSVPAGAAGSERTSLLASSEADPRVSAFATYTSTALALPTAQFSATPVSGAAPLRVSFHDESTGGATAWAWDFGDGGKSARQYPSHRYPKPGTFTVSLTVTGAGGTATTTKPALIVVDFRDVARSHWAYSYIMVANEEGLSTGYPDATYHPEQVVTRDQMATFIARALAGGDAGVPEGPDRPSFTDVPPTNWAYRYVEYAAAWGIAEGYPGGGFGPGRAVDRAQMATFISRAMALLTGEESPDGYQPPATPTFTDVAPTHWAYRYVEYSAARGVVQGYPGGRYRPAEACTRDQMAVYLTRALDTSP